MRLLATAMVAASCFAATDSFNTAPPTACMPTYNARWVSGNMAASPSCPAKGATGGQILIQLNDTRANQATLMYDQYGDDGLRKDQAAGFAAKLRRAITDKSYAGPAARVTYTDSTHFGGYSFMWGVGSTDSIRLVDFAANGSANPTLTDIATETAYTWASGDSLLIVPLGSTINGFVMRSGGVHLSLSGADSTHTVGRAGGLWLTGANTDHDGPRLDDFTSYEVPVLPTRTWYVSLAGTNTNGGTLASPWSLEFALLAVGTADNCANGQVKAGDRIVLRGGTYLPTNQLLAGCLGTVALPIVLTNYPGEDVIVDGKDSAGIDSHYIFNLSATEYVTIKAGETGSFTIRSTSTLDTSATVNSRTTTDSATSDCPPGRGGAVALGLGTRVIGLYIHDVCAGAGPDTDSQDTLLGWNHYLHPGFVSTLDGGSTYNPAAQCFYTQSNGIWQRMIGNICGFGWLQGSENQGSGSSETSGSNTWMEMNTMFNPGAATPGAPGERVRLDGGNAPNKNNVMKNNAFWVNSEMTDGTCLAWFTRGTQLMTLEDNVFACPDVSNGSSTAIPNAPIATYRSVARNVAYGNVEGTLSAAFTDDTHASTRPSSGSVTRYYPSPFGALCHIARFDWAGATSWTPDLLECDLENGQSYEILDGNNRADVLASGTCGASCAPTVASNKTVASSWLGPNRQGGTNPVTHTNASADGRRFSSLVVRRTFSMTTNLRTFSPLGSFPTTVKVLFTYGIKGADMVVNAVPMHTTISRPATGIVAITLNSPSGQSLIYTTRSASGWVYIPGGVPVTIAGATGDCTSLNTSHTTVAGGSLQDGFRLAVAPAGCDAAELAGATVLYQGTSPAVVLSAGPSPIVTGDSFVCTGGTSDWSGVGTFSATDNTFNQISVPSFTVTAPSMAGTIPTCVVNRNPLTYDIRGLSYFEPGSTASVTISGHGAGFAAAEGTHTATISRGRFSIPINCAACGSAAAEVPLITTPKPLDWPSQTVDAAASWSVNVPVPVGVTMTGRHRYYDADGVELFDSGRYDFPEVAAGQKHLLTGKSVSTGKVVIQ